MARTNKPTEDNVIPLPLSGELTEREARIEEAERNGYLVRGAELAAIRDGKLWLERYNFGTFEEYCEHRWELQKTYTYQLINSADLAVKIRNCGLFLPTRESHIRPLLERLSSREGYTDDDRIGVWRDVLTRANGGHIIASDVDDAINQFVKMRNVEFLTLSQWHELDQGQRIALLGRVARKSLNKQDNTDIEWADWSWNPVTGCLHGCPYCYARDIAFSIYPDEVGFSPTIWPDRLTAPMNHHPPDKTDVAAMNIFTCSMADLFGRWVPDEWIEKVLSIVSQAPQWNFLFLTKFPKRMAEFDIPSNAWMGTTVDLQARVSNAERAFEMVKAPVKWLSLEPLSEPLQFERLDLFDWVVIGGASSSKAIDGSPSTPDWNPPIDWIASIHQQARDAGCAIYYKTNSGLSDLSRIREYPGHDTEPKKAPAVFDYLRAIPAKERIG